VALGDRGCGLLEVGLGARDDHHVAALCRQALGAGSADPFAAAGDQRDLAAHAEISLEIPPMRLSCRDLHAVTRLIAFAKILNPMRVVCTNLEVG